VLHYFLPDNSTGTHFAKELPMKGFVPGLLVVLFAGCTSITAADDLSGQWIFKLERDPRGNPGVPVECTITQRRTELTLQCGSGESIRGEVRGRNVTWRREKTGIPPMVEDRLVVTYTGELNDSGTKIKGVFRAVSSVLDFKTDFEAHKKK
jgi:hypothetical protein